MCSHNGKPDCKTELDNTLEDDGNTMLDDITKYDITIDYCDCTYV